MKTNEEEVINLKNIIDMYNTKKVQLFLLHFAGGSMYSFDFLKKHLSSNVEFIPLELPGRGRRCNETLLKNKQEAVQDYFNQIKRLRNDQPYLIYGHSMGATLGLSVADKMEKINDAPNALIVSGNPGPGLTGKEDTKRYLLNDLDFKKVLKELGGVPDEILEDEVLFTFFSPIMRADFESLEKDDFYEKGILLNTPLFAIMGDQESTCNKIENWRNFTKNDFEYQILKGNHFFIYEHSIELMQIINYYSEALIN